ncbi:hypothetical protein [Mycoplasma sp. Ms02]|uniref:hypothetical protein n=1 Tax=Mycoplasma sp. Ms02 TaxID=353851 RepID=UPI001C8A265C|nr:hypothetical protein [Mycoplasma sp. Ms02]QZE12529.1 hypothetical protein K4L35_00875 [Mycoplasma sp. Ms02]
MKSKLLKTLDVYQPLTMSATSVVPNTNTAHILKISTDDDIQALGSELLFRLSYQIADNKISTKKIMEGFSKEDIKNILITILYQMKSQFIVNQDQINAIINVNFEKAYPKLRKEISKYSIASKKTLSAMVVSEGVSEEEISYLSTPEGTYINIESGEEFSNSKYIGLLAGRLEKLSDTFRVLKENLIKAKWDIKINYIMAGVYKTLVSAAFTGLGEAANVALPPVAGQLVSAGLSLSSWLITEGIDSHSDEVRNGILFVNDLIDKISKIEKYPISKTISFISNYKTGVEIGSSLSKAKKYFSLLNKGGQIVKSVSKWTKFIPIISIGADIILNGIQATAKIYETNITIEEKINEIEKTFWLSRKVNQEINDLNVKWFVIEETPLTKSYKKGGTGGKNLKFKNSATKEVFTLEEMLSKSKYELRLMGLEKVQIKKTGAGEWYIRTLKNNLMIDSLG